jgi:hypothetical protein
MAGNIVTDRIQTDTSYASSLAIETNGAERLRIDSSGNVGVGTASPTAPLDVKVGVGNFTVGLQGAGNTQLTSSGALRFNTTSGTTVFAQNATESMRIDSSGNVGIGTSSPAQKLDVRGQGYFQSTSADAVVEVNSSGGSGRSYQIRSQSTGQFYVYDNTAGSARMVIDSSGNVSIGTTSSTTKLYVAGSAASNNYTLTDAATITPDFSQSNNFTITLGGNRTMANATNMTVGQSGVMYITQDGTGSRTLAWGTAWDWPNGGVPTLTTTASAVDVIVYTVRTSTSIVAQLIPNIG